MANLIIHNPEIIFLRRSILEKYCRDMSENPDAFISNLTGTLKYYDAIADIIMEDISGKDKILSYTKFLKESPFKIDLRKWLEENEKNRLHKNAPGEPSVSGNIIRKLIFYGPSKTTLSFKDYFILACYIYISVDRTVILKKLSAANPDMKKTLKPIEAGIQSVNSEATILPFEKKIKCSFKPLDTGSEDTKKLSFDFTGDEIILNRANLDPGNITITSKIQAKLNFKDGKWQITNQSELKTTYIQVIKPFALEKGDVIVFGNKQYLFDETD